jgi:hypothetical protein
VTVLSGVDSTNLSATVSADTSLFTRLSITISELTSTVASYHAG